MKNEKPTLLPIPDLIASLELGQTVYFFDDCEGFDCILKYTVAGASFTSEGWAVMTHDGCHIPYGKCCRTYAEAKEGLADRLRSMADAVLAKLEERGEDTGR